jgi:hypothetical protein
MILMIQKITVTSGTLFAIVQAGVEGMFIEAPD